MSCNGAKQRWKDLERRDKWLDIVLAIILAAITLITLPDVLENLVKFCGLPFDKQDRIIAGVSLMAALLIGWLYTCKVQNHRKNSINRIEYLKEQKINQINKIVFDSLYKSNAAKIQEIFRYTYGNVPEWNSINYKNNVLVYDIHEQVRSILIGLEEVVINIDPERLNDRNVSVELVYCYPGEVEKKYDSNVKEVTELPIDRKNLIPKQRPWKLISSGDTSGNQQSVIEHLQQENSFFLLVDCCGTVFKNDKFAVCKEHQLNLIKERLNAKREDVEGKTFFIKDIRDWERSKGGECTGSAIGTVINIRNDNPEEVFVKAILTINTYGERLFQEQFEGADRDKFGLTEEDYENIFNNTILSTYIKLLETELAQMYIRHSIRNGYRCRETGFHIHNGPEKKVLKCGSCTISACKHKK